jgi:uncharacterized protein (DUF1330 family)
VAAYLVFHNRVTNAEKMQEYLSKVRETMAAYNPEILVFAEHAEVIEGRTNLPRTNVMKFDSRDAAMAWYHSPAYQAVLPLRLEATEGFAVLVDGQ